MSFDLATRHENSDLPSFVAALLIFGAQPSIAGNEFPEALQQIVLSPNSPGAAENLGCCTKRPPGLTRVYPPRPAEEESTAPVPGLTYPTNWPPNRSRPSITGNPAAVNALPGTGLAGRLLRLPESSGIRLGGLWLADTNGLISGGKQPGKWSWNSALIIGANLDAEKLLAWKGASFGVQFLRFDGQDTNGQAGSVQGYNSLPGPKPLDRSELYQLWYRQALFDDKVIFRIGKIVPTYDFNNVARHVSSTQDEGLDIPAVTGLLYTPVFVNPTLLGAIGGYYNSVYGITLTLAPTRNTYRNYGTLYAWEMSLTRRADRPDWSTLQWLLFQHPGDGRGLGGGQKISRECGQRDYGIRPAFCKGRGGSPKMVPGDSTCSADLEPLTGSSYRG